MKKMILIIFILFIFSGCSTSPENNTSKDGINETPKIKEEEIIINKNIGDEVEFATIKLKVLNCEEKQVLSTKYSGPYIASEEAKFVVIEIELTNITTSTFSFTDNIVVIDNKNREFKSYENSIGSVDNYMAYRELSPSIKEKGYIIYELPTDATSYSIVMGKGGTRETYKILLK